MANETATRRELLQSLGALPLMALLAHPPTAAAQAPGASPAKVDTKGLTARSSSRASSPAISASSTASTSCA